MVKKKFRTQQAIEAFEKCLQTSTLPSGKVAEVKNELNKAKQRLAQQDAEVLFDCVITVIGVIVYNMCSCNYLLCNIIVLVLLIILYYTCSIYTAIADYSYCTQGNSTYNLNCLFYAYMRIYIVYYLLLDLLNIVLTLIL